MQKSFKWVKFTVSNLDESKWKDGENLMQRHSDFTNFDISQPIFLPVMRIRSPLQFNFLIGRYYKVHKEMQFENVNYFLAYLI